MSVTIFECPECASKLVRGEDGPRWDVSDTGRQRQYRPDAYRNEWTTEIDKLPELDFGPPKGKVKHCPGCLIVCHDCDAMIYVHDETGDVYAAGANMLPEGKYHIGDGVCMSCYEEHYHNADESEDEDSDD